MHVNYRCCKLGVGLVQRSSVRSARVLKRELYRRTTVVPHTTVVSTLHAREAFNKDNNEKVKKHIRRFAETPPASRPLSRQLQNSHLKHLGEIT